MATYLDRILDAHRAAASVAERALDDLVDAARSSPPTRGFGAALTASAATAGPGGGAGLAEIKRRAPSEGALAPHLAPVTLARSYEAGGAACLSVLTDVEFFGGSPD